MPLTTSHVSISLDGFVAGPDQSLADPIGVGGDRLHTWLWSADEPGNEGDAAARDDLLKPRGGFVMGRNMFGPVRGGWDTWADDWRGWWGDDPPYHAPVFVLTQHAHEPIEMEGGTTFHFVTDGFAAAHTQAVAVAGDREITVAGGASTIRQALAAGVLDALTLDIVPVLLGRGERLFDGVDDPGLTPVEVVESPRATHVRYRIGGPTLPA